MNVQRDLLQIVPRAPGGGDGVADYARTVAIPLQTINGFNTTFVSAAPEAATATAEGFLILSPLSAISSERWHRYHNAAVILHYVNYGYQTRGVPFSLRRFVQQRRKEIRGRWLTVFHELYAFGPPWKSEFWLRPLQVKIARDLIDISDACFVSNRAIQREIRTYAPAKKIYLAPITSSFGEPEIDDFSICSPSDWAICGGTALVARSLNSFRKTRAAVPAAFAPARLHVIGGRDHAPTRELLECLAREDSGLSCSYHPEVSAERASELLGQCSFAWLDYFGAGRIWPGMILKSSAFAACCAHGLVPIFSHREDPVTVEEDPLPGPFFITPREVHFPSRDGLRATREKIYAWYRAHADSRRLAEIFAEALA